jgi:hypothetical protein
MVAKLFIANTKPTAIHPNKFANENLSFGYKLASHKPNYSFLHIQIPISFPFF